MFFCTTRCLLVCFFFFFNDPATPEIYPLPLHDALPICGAAGADRAASTTHILDDVLLAQILGELLRDQPADGVVLAAGCERNDHAHRPRRVGLDRKSTRLNSSHSQISYAVFCLKKKTNS